MELWIIAYFGALTVMFIQWMNAYTRGGDGHVFEKTWTLAIQLEVSIIYNIVVSYLFVYKFIFVIQFMTHISMKGRLL